MLKEIKTAYKHYFVDEYDLIQGEFKSYHDNGQLMELSFYINDKLHSEYKYYYVNGQIFVHTFFQNGKLHGERKVYHDNGQLWDHSFHQNGKLHGEYHRRDENGKLTHAGFFYDDTDLHANPDTLTEKDKAYILLSGRLPPKG